MEQCESIGCIDICQARGFEFPGVRSLIDPDQLSMYYGRLLNRLFRDTEEITIDRFKIRAVIP